MASERTVAVIPAAGRSERMGGRTNKVFLPLGDRPLLAHTLGVFEACPLVDAVVVAVGGGEEEACRREVVEPFELRKVSGIIHGGASRTESVWLALRYIGGAASLVVVHDGARPLVPEELLRQAIEAGRERGAVVVGLPAKDTVKRVTAPGTQRGNGRRDGHAGRPSAEPANPFASPPAPRVLETLDRSGLWQIQTPQVFWRDLLEMAYRRATEAGAAPTDDASLVERLRHPVYVLPGSEENIKVTTPLDLVLARAILDHRALRSEGGTGP